MREAWAAAGAVEPAAGEVEGAGKLGPSFGAGAGCGVGLGVGLIGGSTPPLNPRPPIATMPLSLWNSPEFVYAYLLMILG